MSHHHNHHGEHCGHCDHKHHHEHHHEHHNMYRQVALIIATIVLLVGAVVIEHQLSLERWQLLLVYLAPYLLIGSDTLKEAAEGLAKGDAFNEHLLMTIATIGALAIGFLPGAEAQFTEAVAVMLFFQVGELFEGYAEGQSRKSIAHLMDIRPDIAHVTGQDVRPEEVAVGTVITIRPGEKVPLDGVVVEGSSALNMVALTGESKPRNVGVGDEVVSGSVNCQLSTVNCQLSTVNCKSGLLKVRTTKSFGESTASRIIRLVEEAGEHKSAQETFITRFARVYTPTVVVAAVLIAVVPPMFNCQLSTVNCQLSTINYQWIYRALLFLVVSCPCALVLSVPLTFFGGIGGASRRGILIKGANYLDVLAKLQTVVFDKTGTLTEGNFQVTAVNCPTSSARYLTPEGISASRFDLQVKELSTVNCQLSTVNERQLLHLAAHAERFSTHPIGAALRSAFPEEAIDGCEVTQVEELAGMGIRAKVGDRLVCVGNTRLMETAVIPSGHQDAGTVIHVSIDGEYAGHIVVGDHLKDDSVEAIRQLHEMGVSRTVMLTGDREEVAAEVARQLALTEYHAELLPADKVAQVERLMADTSNSVAEKRRGTLAFVGDGINDAPVLARADVGIAMGALGSDAAVEAADVVLMDDHPSKIATAIAISRRTLAIARQNVWLAIGIKVAVLLLAVLGLATMWMAVFADVGVTVLAVLNAMRTLGTNS